MDIRMLTDFFMWCTIINGSGLIVSFLFCAFAGDFVYRIHSTWFAMPRETFTVVIYVMLGFYKSIFIALNVIPWVALMIIG